MKFLSFRKVATKVATIDISDFDGLVYYSWVGINSLIGLKEFYEMVIRIVYAKPCTASKTSIPWLICAY